MSESDSRPAVAPARESRADGAPTDNGEIAPELVRAALATVKRPECDCMAYQDQMPKIDAPIIQEQLRTGRKLAAGHFIAWQFCPWCGSELLTRAQRSERYEGQSPIPSRDGGGRICMSCLTPMRDVTMTPRPDGQRVWCCDRCVNVEVGHGQDPAVGASGGRLSEQEVDAVIRLFRHACERVVTEGDSALGRTVPVRATAEAKLRALLLAAPASPTDTPYRPPRCVCKSKQWSGIECPDCPDRASSAPASPGGQPSVERAKDANTIRDALLRLAKLARDSTGWGYVAQDAHRDAIKALWRLVGDPPAPSPAPSVEPETTARDALRKIVAAWDSLTERSWPNEIEAAIEAARPLAEGQL